MSILSQLLIMLAAGVLIVPIAQYLKLGSVPGFLIAGILVGPSVTGLIENSGDIHTIAKFGVVFLLFVIGMEVNPSRLWHTRSWVLGMGLLQILLTGSVLTMITHHVFLLPLNISILIGATLALSSTAFVMQILLDNKVLNTTFGRAAFSVLVLQDLAVVPLLVLLGFLSNQALPVGDNFYLAIAEGFALLAIVVLAGRYLLQPVLNLIAQSKNTEIFTATALLLVLGVAILTEHIGLSMEVGAFIAGLLIADSSYRHQITAEIHPFRGVLLGLFFMTMGLSVNLQACMESPLIILGLTLGFIAIKIIFMIPILYIFKLHTNQTLATALLLAQGGEFALVIFLSAFQQSLLSETLYQQLLLIVLFSMLVTPLLAHLAMKINGSRNYSNDLPDIEKHTARIVLAGFGRVGQRVGRMLNQLNIDYIAIDNKPTIVEAGKKSGHNVFYGDARKQHVFSSLKMPADSIVIISIDDFEACESLVSMLSSHYPAAYIIARGHNAKHCKLLLSLGAADIVSENLEVSLQLSRLALIEAGVESDRYEDLLSQYKFEYYEDIS